MNEAGYQAPSLSPAARTVYQVLLDRWNGHPQAGRFIRDVKEAFEDKGYFITGDEFGEIISELHRSGLVKFQVRRDAIGLVPVLKFRKLTPA